MKNKEHGVSIYIAFMITTILLGIALGMGNLLFAQLGILKGLGHSIFAFYATEAGLEHALYLDNTICPGAEDHGLCLAAEFDNIPSEEMILNNGASYKLKAESPGDAGCPDTLGYSHCVRAEGSYKQAKRAIRIAR